MHQSTHYVQTDQVLCLVEHCYTRQHRVLPPAETAEHVPSVRKIPGLPEDLLLEDDDRICSQHHRGRELLCDVLGFGVSDPHGICPRQFIGQRTLIDVGGNDGERYGQLCQQFPTPR
jgi:hypothetical protein